MTAVIFPKAKLAAAIASRGLTGYAGESVTISDASGLTLTAPSGPAASDQTYSFTLGGNASILYVVDPEKIAQAVAGKSRSAAKALISGFPEVKSAVLVLRPFWAGNFPEDGSKIKVKVEDSGKK
jgi:hypothetical protein